MTNKSLKKLKKDIDLMIYFETKGRSASALYVGLLEKIGKIKLYNESLSEIFRKYWGARYELVKARNELNKAMRRVK